MLLQLLVFSVSLLTCAVINPTGAQSPPTAPIESDLSTPLPTPSPNASLTANVTGKLAVQKLEVTHNLVSLKWRAPIRVPAIGASLEPAQAMVYYTEVPSAAPVSTDAVTWTSSNVKIGVSSDQRIGTALIERLNPNTSYFVRVEESGTNETFIVRTKDGCLINSTSIPVGGKYQMGCDQTCTCHPKGRTECKDRCRYRSGSIVDGYCKEVPDENDPECCVSYQCKDNNMEVTAPKVLVTQRTPTSLTIAWDDFKLPNYESGYVVQYRPVSALDASEPWVQIQANNTPFLSLPSLRPHSAYQVKIGVWEDADKKKVSATVSETITAFTEDGCLRNNQTYSVGQEFSEGCDLRCVCRGSDEGECSDRCQQPYFRAGLMKADPGCSEEPIPGGDECCVLVKCSGASHELPRSEQPLSPVTFSDKPGFCPDAVEGRLKDEAGNCLEECQHDYHCTSSQKCCPTSCGGSVCSNPMMGRNLCESVVCGPNADCILPKEAATGSGSVVCRCKAGFIGDPDDLKRGCKRGTRSKRMCDHNNKTYGIEEEFNSGCEKCICTESLEVECHPRCPFSIPSGGDLIIQDPLCSVIQDPADSCCKMIACQSKPEAVFNATGSDPVNGTANTVSVNMPLPIEGCTYRNKTYRPGDVFNEGCEARCTCESHGTLTCLPRCSLFQGYDKNFCQLVADPLDPECCKIALCDQKEGARKDNPALILDSAEPYNSTTAKLRIISPNGNNDTAKLNLQLLYAKVDTQFGETEKLKLVWEMLEVAGDEVRILATNVYEVDISGLEPSTEYFIKAADMRDNSTSNTVVVRTYPPGIDSSFNGCFHGNRTYDIGQQFFDGCEYKCVCREGGLRECEERCPIYIDTVGYENCDWQPAPDDSCCTIPVCEKPPNKFPKKPLLDPESEKFCYVEGKVYSVGQTWQEGNGCLRKSCECGHRSNGSTGVECKGGCAPIPATAMKPTLECPRPDLISPEDPCLCPYVVCNHKIPPISLPPGLPGGSSNRPPQPKEGSSGKQFCELKDRQIPIGEEVYDGCRAVCHCDPDAHLNCALIECPHHFAPHVSECMEWDIDPNFIPKPPQCCPPPKCKNEGGCTFAGIKFNNFKQIPQELLPCGTRCVCVNGNITCENRCPPLTDIPPQNLPCPPSMSYRGHLPGDSCCLHWMCREPDRAAFCLHNGRRYKLSEQWDDATPANGISTRRRCQCKPNANGVKPVVECYPGNCPQITERHLRPTPECPIPVVVAPEEPAGVMCPYVVCNYSEETGNDPGKDLDHVSVVAMNGSAVRIRFTLPQILVGLVGHAELHFTTDPTLPRSEWHVQKFARPKRLFDTANIEYHLGNLRPDTNYFFQIRIIVEALQTGPESEIYKLKMPALPTTTTTTSTTTSSTTTLPPLIMVDLRINAIPIDYSTVTVAWKPLEPYEKQYVDGVQLRFKRVEAPDSDWATSPMIHRDLTTYVLRDLHPGLSYTIDLLFKTADNLMTSVVSTKPVVVDMPAKPRDDFEFQVSIDPLNDIFVDSSRSVIHLRGAPHPANKFINVVKISYKMDVEGEESQSNQMVHTFKVPSDDGTVVLDGLQPHKRYKAWVDLFLANGRKISSNAVEFMTKEGKTIIDQRSDDPSANEAEALREGQTSGDQSKPYYIALVIVAMFAVVTGVGFVTLLCVLLRAKSSAKAPITRAPSESAYDNPTYKTYDNERPGDDRIKNGSVPA